MSEKQGSPVSSSDMKKWGIFAVFLVILAAIVYFLALQPGGEDEARGAIDEAEALNEQARLIASRTNTPADLASVDISTEALRKAKAFLVEHDYGRANEEAVRSKNQSNKVIGRQSSGSETRARARFQELTGAVSVKKRFASNFVPAQLDLPLDVGDLIHADQGGSARVQFANQMDVIIEPGGKVSIPDMPVNQQDSAIKELYLEEGNLIVKATDSERKSGVLNAIGKVVVFPGSEVWVSQLADGGMSIRVARGRAEANNREGTANILMNQRLMLSPNGAPGPPESIPRPPDLIAPDNFSSLEANQNGFASVTLSWQPSSSGYLIEVSNNAMFNGFVERMENVTRDSVNFPNLREGNYYWRVMGVDKGRVGLPSPYRQFEITGSKAGPRTSMIDEKPPMLDIYRDKILVQGYVVIVQGKVERGSAVSVEGETAFVDSETGEFRCTLNFPGKGIYTLDIIATDRSGNHAREEIKVEIRD